MIELLAKIVLYANENWNKNGFTENELGKYICDYYVEYVYSTTNNKITHNMKTLIDSLIEDNTTESKAYAKELCRYLSEVM